MNGARIGELQCAHARFINFGGFALNADGIHVEGSVHLNGSYSEGEVCFVGASITGNLECVRSRFGSPGRMALNGDHITVGASVLLRECRCLGQVRLLEGKIGGSLECQRGAFLNPLRHTIEACRLNVSGDVFFSDGFQSVGIIHMRAAKIGGQLACRGARFLNPGGDTLDVDGTTVHNNVLFNSVAEPLAVKEFFNAGVISLVNTDIRGNLEFVGARFGPFSAVNARLASGTGGFFLKSVRHDPSLLIHLEGASADSLEDEDESSWPSPGNLYLEGFIYNRISGRLGPDERLRWLHLQYAKEPNVVRRFGHAVLYGGQRLHWRNLDWPDFRPQPYQQLAKVLRDMGDNGGAKRVLIDMEDSRRKYGNLNFASWIWRWLLKGVIGYGYRPGYALIWAFVFVGIGWGLASYNADLFTPTEREAYRQTKFSASQIAPTAPPYYPPFNPIVYSIDTFLPIINLGQKDRWMPNIYRGHRVSLPNWLPHRRVITGRLLRLWLWIHIALGWLLTTLFVAGLTPVIRKD
jgi:hypothetical protein